MENETGLIDDEEQRKLLQFNPLEEQPKPKNDFFSAADRVQVEVDSEADSQLKSSMFYASQKDPDSHAKNVKTGQAANMQPEAVELSPEQAESRAKFNKFKTSADIINKEYQDTGKILSNKDYAAVVQDDIGTFQTLEDIWKATMTGEFEEAAIKGASALYFKGKEAANFTEDKVFRAPTASIINMVASVPSNIGYLWDEASFKSAQLLDLVTPDSMDKYLYTQEDTPEFIKSFNEATRFLSPATVGKESGAAIRSFADVVDVPKERKDWMTDITGAMGQILGMVATAGLGGATAASSLMFSQGADMQRQAMESEGVRPRIENMLVGGAITMATERFGVDRLFNRLPAPVRQKFLGLVADVAKASTIEMFEEFVEGIAHSTVEYLTFNEDVDFFDGIVEEMRAAGGAAAGFRIILNTLGAKRAKLNLKDYSGEQTKIDDIIKASEESVAKDRDPDIVREHVENLIDTHGHSDSIYMAAEDIAEAFQELSLDQTIPEIKNIYDQIPEAIKMGGDVVIPTQDFVAYFTESDTVSKIRQHIRLSPDSLSQAELDSVQDEDRDDIKKLMEDALAEQKFKTEVDEVTDNIIEQLIETGRMSSSNARLNSEIVSSYVATQASNEGITPTEFYERLGLQIKGDKVKVPESTASGLNYNQDFGDIKFKDQKIHSVTGKKVNIEREGQRVWEQNVKRRKQVLKVKDCING